MVKVVLCVTHHQVRSALNVFMCRYRRRLRREIKVEPNPCPWCKSVKIMAEVNGNCVVMVCQKCLARGPEIHRRPDVSSTVARNIALSAWNDRNHGKFSRLKCPDCGRLISMSACGLRQHNRRPWPLRCPGSGKLLSAIPNEVQPLSEVK
jgi:hypothetical protein